LGVFRELLKTFGRKTCGGRGEQPPAAVVLSSIEQKTGDPVMQEHCRRVVCTPLLVAALSKERVR